MTLRQDQQQPLTRRQLREMERAAQAGETGEQQVPAVVLPFSSGNPAAPAELHPELTTDAPAAAPAEEAPGPAPQAATPVVVPLTRRQLRELRQRDEPPEHTLPEPPAPLASLPPAPEGTSAPEVQDSLPPVPVIPAQVISVAPAPEPVSSEPAAPEIIDEAPAQPTTGEVRAYQPPTGHWSLGAGESFDDVIASGVEDAHARSVESSGASSTASALIVPVVPSAADMTGPLNATGEILLTGSIDLPRGLGSTGQVQGRFDGSDIDHLLDQHDRDSNTGVEPVAATHAIATHAVPSVNPNIVPPQQVGHRIGAIVGSVAGGVALLGVAGVLVAGFLFHAF